MLSGRRVGFVGAGSMSQALVQGLVGGGVLPPENVIVTNRRNAEVLALLQSRWGVRVTRDKAEVAGSSDVLVLAVKPADMGRALEEIRGHVRSNQVVISVAAGIPLAAVERQLPQGTPVIRAMPNTSSRIGASATAIAPGRWADPDSLALARAVFQTVGHVTVVPEEYLDAVTAVSGSGPAYIYLVIETLIGAAERLGLPRDTARELVVQTVLGAARMVSETGADPAELRRQVTSPNGTTAAALQVLEERGFQEALAAAVARAAQRARELAQLAGGDAAPEADRRPA